MKTIKLSLIDVPFLLTAAFLASVVLISFNHAYRPLTFTSSGEMVITSSVAISTSRASVKVVEAPRIVAVPLPMTAPKVLRSVQPQYPAEQLRKGIEGVVVVSALIDESGNVKETKIVRSSGNEGLDSSAASGLASWKFDPAKRGGQAVPSRFEMPVRFNLTGKR
jgi:TonB family protein